MSKRSTEQIRELLDSLYRVESGRILATLIRLLGDFDLAEEAMHEAFAAALSLWPRSGVPGNPRPWLISTARFKAIDTLRRRAREDISDYVGRWKTIVCRWHDPGGIQGDGKHSHLERRHYRELRACRRSPNRKSINIRAGKTGDRPNVPQFFRTNGDWRTPGLSPVFPK
jgi:DNA-directed RNA polymerase specialized sigma24 family protein